MSKVVPKKKKKKEQSRRLMTLDIRDPREKIIQAFERLLWSLPHGFIFHRTNSPKSVPRPSMKIFLSPSGWRFGSLKRSRWRDPKESSVFLLCVSKRERGRKVGGNDLLSSKGYYRFLIERNCEEVYAENMFNSNPRLMIIKKVIWFLAEKKCHSLSYLF